MTPNAKTKFKDLAQIRALPLFSPAAEAAPRLESSHYVEGIAARYEPYVLYYDRDDSGNQVPIYERFERGCFDGCDMGDVIMQYDHAGRVMARTGNGSLLVAVTDAGLSFAADLSRTDAARALYDDIKAGMVTKMSWRFRCGDYYYDKDTRTIIHTRVAKIYDLAPVSIPANDETEVHARAWVDGEIAQAARSEAALDERRRKLRLYINNTLGG